jgi:hypothetical protein
MQQEPSVVHPLSDAWEQHFPDVPWVERSLFVPLPAGQPACEFTFVFTGIDELPLIELVWHEEGAAPTADMDVDLRRTEQGIAMKLEGFDSSWLRGFSLRQQGDCRLAGLGVLQRDGAAWQTIYNSRRRSEAFKEFLADWFEQRSPEEQQEVAPLALLAGELAFGNVSEMTRMIDQSAHAQAMVRANAWLPARFGLEYTTHGLKRTFRFWSAQARADSLREAVDVVQALSTITDDACVFGGAALGLHREGRLLPHDDDLDILCVVDRHRCPDLGTALDRIAAVLHVAGWQVTGHFFSHLWVKSRFAGAPTLDVFVGIAEGDRISYYPLPRRGLEKARMFPREWRSLEGVDIPVPRDLVYYFESEYGPRWQVPDAEFRLDWDRRPYADLAGNRSHPMLCTRGEQAFVARENARRTALPASLPA